MQNASSQAAGEAVSANAAGLVHNAMTAMLFGSDRAVRLADTSDAIEAALSAYLAEARVLRRLQDAYSVARAKLPTWANAGPRYLLHDGSKGGGNVGWPEAAELPAPPEHAGTMRLIRPSPREVWERATWAMSGVPMRFQNPDGTIETVAPSPLALANQRSKRLAGFAAVRTVIARIREQREEKRKLDLPRFEAAMEASCQRLEASEDHLCALVNDASPTDITFMVLFEFFHGQDAFFLALLKRVAPSLSGLVRVVVDDLIASEGGSIRDTMLAGGEGVA